MNEDTIMEYLENLAKTFLDLTITLLLGAAAIAFAFPDASQQIAQQYLLNLWLLFNYSPTKAAIGAATSLIILMAITAVRTRPKVINALFKALIDE